MTQSSVVTAEIATESSRTIDGPASVDRPSNDWARWQVPDLQLARFPAGSRILDIGFGNGEQLRHLARAGCRGVGMEVNAALARKGRTSGLVVCRGRAEQLPFESASMDGIVCKVVVPYTDEAFAIAEMARVLRPGGVAKVLYQGSGYFLRYLVAGDTWKRRLYGARVFANTLLYRIAGRRLPGFWGDTLLQTRRRLRRYYRRHGLDLTEDRPAPRFSRCPVFIYHEVRRADGLATANGECGRSGGGQPAVGHEHVA